MHNTLFSLRGKVALVTGGSKGLGKAMAHSFSAAGADCFITSRHQDELEKAAAEITRDTSGQVAWCVADQTRRGDSDLIAEAALKKFGRVDVLVNNAGSNVPQAVDQIKDADWDRIVELNLNSCMALSRALVPQMKERQWGRIIHISSIMGLASKAGRDCYSTTKAALIGLARAMALDLGRHGITVNCLAPGPFLTDLPGKMLTAEEKKSFADRTAVGRWGDPAELGGPALMLASDAGSYITGTTLVVDGGTLCNTF